MGGGGWGGGGSGNLRTPLTAVSTAARNEVTKTVSEKQLVRNNSAARQSMQLHLPPPPPPPLDLPWALMRNEVRERCLFPYIVSKLVFYAQSTGPYIVTK